MDIKAYRKKMEAEIRAADKPHWSITAAETVEQLDKKSETARARKEAIERTDVDPENLDPLAEQYIKTIGDKSEAVSVRLAALKGLKVMEFSSPSFDRFRSDYHKALQGMVDDKSPTLRDHAIEVLAIASDPYVKDRLLKDLKDTKEALVPIEKAIQYLAYDEHSEAISTVRGMFDKLKTSAKEQAVRMLAADPKSSKLLTKLVKDKDEKSSIRCLGAASLKNADPKAFRKIAKEIIDNDDDYDEIRAACLSTLSAGAAEAKEWIDDKFAERVEKIETKSRNLRAAAKRFLGNLR